MTVRDSGMDVIAPSAAGFPRFLGIVSKPAQASAKNLPSVPSKHPGRRLARSHRREKSLALAPISSIVPLTGVTVRALVGLALCITDADLHAALNP